MPAVMTPAEVAATLKVRPETVYRWCRDGTLSSIRFAGTVRIRASAIEALIGENNETTEER